MEPRYSPEEFADLRARRPVARDPVAHLRERFGELVADELEEVGGTPGLLLSGGVDSALMLGLLLSQGVKPVCFTAGRPDSPDAEQARALAEHLALPWVLCEIPEPEELGRRLRGMLDRLGFSGLHTVASGLALELCFAAATDRGVGHVFAGNGIDLIFGGGVARERIEAEPGESFHARFWSHALPILENRYGRPDPVDVYGTLAAHHGIRLHMPFERVEAAQAARDVDAATFFSGGRDKVPVRALTCALGIPAESAYRPKDPLQRSSGLLDALEELMFGDAPTLVEDQMSSAYATADDRRLALRFYLRLLAQTR